MDFGHRCISETGNGGLLDRGDPHIHEVAKAAREELQQPIPPLVSARAYDKYAIVTLETTRADEAVEPFSNKDLRQPLTVAFRQREAGRSASLIEPLPQLQTPAKWKSARIAIKAKGRILLIDPADIIAVEAMGNYVLLKHTSSSHVLRESISTIEKKLSPHGFVRIHRSVLVNAVLVEEIHPWSTGEYMLRVRGGSEYTVTRTYKKNLQLLAQAWIGTDGFVAE
jgi:DNA-binding LytR/AlgR family response regulator